jgi:hypothetical protein
MPGDPRAYPTAITSGPRPTATTPEPTPPPRTPETRTFSGLEFSGLLTPQKPRRAAPTLREAEAAGNTSDVDVEQQLLSYWVGGDSVPDVPLLDILLPDVPLTDVALPDVPLPDVPRPDVPLPDVALPDVPRPDVPLPETRPDGSVDEE